VITTGGDPEHGLPGPVPDNARVEAFVPHTALLPHVDLMITNGGYGGVMTALAHGVPLIVAGTTEEKPEIAARVAWSGAGLDLRTKRPSPRQIADATRTVLGDPRYRRNAERIRDDFGRHDAPREAADLLEELAATGPARPGVLADASGR
jgi:UDP:flavonoid glycosyltransferase YjiC (YdhE family)